MARERGLDLVVAMDGGVDAGNITEVVAAGTGLCVAGSAIFGQDDPAAAMAELRRLGEAA